MSSGFDTCDENGKYIEPLSNVWTGLYACLECGRIINQDTYEVVSSMYDLSSFGIRYRVRKIIPVIKEKLIYQVNNISVLLKHIIEMKI